MLLGPYEITPELRRKAKPGESLSDRRILQFSKKEGKRIDDALAKVGAGFAPLVAEIMLKVAEQIERGAHEKASRAPHTKLRPTRRYPVKRGLRFN